MNDCQFSSIHEIFEYLYDILDDLYEAIMTPAEPESRAPKKMSLEHLPDWIYLKDFCNMTQICSKSCLSRMVNQGEKKLQAFFDKSPGNQTKVNGIGLIKHLAVYGSDKLRTRSKKYLKEMCL